MSNKQSGATWRAQNRAHYDQQRAKRNAKPNFEEKTKDRAELEAASAEYLAAGGKIQQVRSAQVFMGPIEGVDIDFMTGSR